MTILSIPISVLLTVLLAALVQSSVGFGYALITVPVLLLILDAKTVVLVALMTSAVLNILIVTTTWRKISGRIVLPLIAASSLGTIPGAYLLKVVDAGVLKLWVGAVVFVTALIMLTGKKLQFRNGRLAQLMAGFGSGILGSSTGMSGPPVVLCLVDQGHRKDVFRASLAAFFLLNNLISLAMHARTGSLTWEIARLGLSLVPAQVIGFAVGLQLLPRLKEGIFRRVVVGIVMVSGFISVVTCLR